MVAVKEFCLTKYGAERMAEKRALMPLIEDIELDLRQPDSNIDNEDLEWSGDLICLNTTSCAAYLVF